MRIEELKDMLSPICVVNPHLFREPQGFSIDSRTIKPSQGFIALKGKFCDGHNFIKDVVEKSGSLVITEQPSSSDNFPICNIVVKDTYDALKRISYYILRRYHSYIIAITGSIGKTTTKEMVAFLLKDKFSLISSIKTENNILGVCKTILHYSQEKIIVLEVGTNACGEIEEITDVICPNIGLITSIKPVHLEKLKNLKGVYEEKTKLLKYKKTTPVLNGDDYWLRKFSSDRKIIWFGRHKKNDFFARLLHSNKEEFIFLVNDMYKVRIKRAPFYIYNALGAISVAYRMGMDIKEMCERLSDFDSYPNMHMEKVEKNGFIFINDSYNSNPYALICALDNFKQLEFKKKVVVIGDMRELGKKSPYYHRKISQHISKDDFVYIITVGEETQYTYNSFKERGYNNCFHFISYKDVVKFLKERVDKGTLIFIKGSRVMGLERIIEEI